MSSGCGDVLSLADLQTAKKHQLFEAEVITGKSGGVAGGADIDYATNQVTGQTQKTLPAVLRDAGFQPAAFTFVTGGTLNVGGSDMAVLWPIPGGGDGQYYIWKGAYPKVIPAGSTPATTGGVSASGWLPLGDITLRADLASTSAGKGAALVASKQPFTGSIARTQHSKNTDLVSVKDFGAVGDGVTDDTTAIKAAIAAAASYSNRAAAIYFPGGFYNVSATINVPSWVILIGGGVETTQIRCTDNTVDKILSFTGEFCGARFMTVRYASKPTTHGTAVWVHAFHPQFIGLKTIDTYIGAWVVGETTDTDSGLYSGAFFLNCELNDAYYSSLIIGANNAGFVNDIYFHHGIIAAGSTDFTLGAIRILGRAESINIAHVDIIGGVKSFTSDPGTTSGLRFSDFTSVFFDSSASAPEFTGLNHFNFTDCWFSNGRTNSQPAAIFTSCKNVNVKGARAFNAGTNGFTVNACSYFNISDSIFNYSNYSNVATAYHIFFNDTCSHFNVIGCRSSDTTNTVAAGVLVSEGATYYNLRDNHFSAVTVPIAEPSASTTGRVVAGNASYVSKATGTGTLAASTKSVVVSHGLSLTPLLKHVCIQQNGATVNPLYVSAVSATTFTVGTANSNTSAAGFTWSVDASEA